jgi:septin family protein
MKRLGLLIFFGLIFFCAVSWGQVVYQWTDEKGILHFTDDMSLIPEKYRNQVLEKKGSTEPPPLPVDTKDKRDKILTPAPKHKDILGRGEEWWRMRVNEWNEKLLNASEKYETAFAEWQAKEKELEESKFKPKSLQRKLQTEIKFLEDKVKDWEKQMEEAKNMLENVLPKEAVDYHADPKWLEIEK